MEVGDTLGFADVLLAEVRYELRPWRALQMGVLAAVDRQVYDRSPDRDNHAFQIGGSLRYFGLGYWLSPEVGVATGHRDVVLDGEDFGERTLWLTLRSVPHRRAYLSVRFRARQREYQIGDPGARNFSREDDRRDLTLTVDLALSDRWGWIAYLSYQDAASTRDSRTFETQYVWTGLNYRLR
jgi:hypothetical protein